MDNEKYTGNAEEYLKYRNDYPKEFFDYLYKHVGIECNSSIADIGSGTGKLSKQLLLKGNKVFSVEPNHDMRKTAENYLDDFGNFISVNGTAENTTLNKCSVDFVTVGTAFHWFDALEFKKECQRILKPHGKVVLVWNSRPVNRKTEINEDKALERFVINFDGISGGNEEQPELFASFFKDGEYEYNVFQERVCFNKTSFIGRALSTFHKLNEDKHIEELSHLFDMHCKEGDDFLSMTLYTRSITGEV